MKIEQANVLAALLDDAQVIQQGAEWVVKEAETIHETIGAGLESLLSKHLDAKASKEDNSIVVPDTTLYASKSVDTSTDLKS